MAIYGKYCRLNPYRFEQRQNELGFNQKNLAEWGGVSREWVGKVGSGKERCGMELADKFARILSVGLADIADEIPEDHVRFSGDPFKGVSASFLQFVKVENRLTNKVMDVFVDLLRWFLHHNLNSFMRYTPHISTTWPLRGYVYHFGHKKEYVYRGYEKTFVARIKSDSFVRIMLTPKSVPKEPITFIFSFWPHHNLRLDYGAVQIESGTGRRLLRLVGWLNTDEARGETDDNGNVSVDTYFGPDDLDFTVRSNIDFTYTINPAPVVPDDKSTCATCAAQTSSVLRFNRPPHYRPEDVELDLGGL